MRMLTRRTRLRAALAAVAAAAAVLVVGPGYHQAEVRMHSSAVWLASGQTGEVTLVDGAAAEVMTHVPVAAPGTALTVTQRGGSAVVLDRKTGRLSGVDGATERVTPTQAVLPASEGLVVLPSEDALWVVDVHSGMTTAVDPATLAPRGEPLRLAESIRPGNVAVDDRGRVWAIDDTTGELVWLSEDRRRTRTATKTGRLTTTGGRVALVDPARGTAELLDPMTGAVTRSVRLGTPADDTVVIGGSADGDRLLVAMGSRGELVSCTFGEGCAAPVKVGAAGADLGSPIAIGDHAVVPDRSTGQATIVDLSRTRVVARRQLFDQPVRFELIARGDVVFFNDPDGNTAGVLDLRGDVRTVTKHTGDSADGEVRPSPDQHGQAGQVTEVDHHEDEGRLGLPGRNDRATPQTPGPPPPASILVSPRPHGVVGDEFELTLVLPHATARSTSWSFGDGSPAGSGTTIRHRWQRPGTFPVRATAAFENGRTAQSEITVTITGPGAPPGIAGITVQRPRPVIGEPVHFSADTTEQPDSWRWTATRIGAVTAETTASTAEFDHRFTTPGRYTVTLTITKGTRTSQSSRQFAVALGAVKGWGDMNNDALQIPPEASSGVIAIEAGHNHVVALKSDGSVIAWSSQLYDEITVPAEASSGVVAISVGSSNNLALKVDGTIVEWGDPPWSELKVIPEEAKRGVVAISAGSSHNLVLKADGSVITWGHGSDPVPREAQSGVIAISAGHQLSMALKADGTVVTWGTRPCNWQPVHDAVTIAAGEWTCLAVLQNGSVVATSALGSPFVRPNPMPATAQSGVVAVSTYWDTYLGLKADGSAFGWGGNTDGQATIPPECSRGVLAVTSGQNFSLAVLDGLS